MGWAVDLTGLHVVFQQMCPALWTFLTVKMSLQGAPVKSLVDPASQGMSQKQAVQRATLIP